MYLKPLPSKTKDSKENNPFFEEEKQGPKKKIKPSLNNSIYGLPQTFHSPKNNQSFNKGQLHQIKKESILIFISDENSNVYELYNVSNPLFSHYHSKLPEHYIGPLKFVLVSNKQKANMVKFSIDNHNYKFELPCVIIAGLKEEFVALHDENCEKHEKDITELDFNDNETYFLPQDLPGDGEAAVGKLCFNQPDEHFLWPKNLNQKTVKQMEKELPLSLMTSKSLVQIVILSQAEIKRFFEIFNDSEFKTICFLNIVMCSEDATLLANLVLSYHCAEPNMKEEQIEVINFFKEDNKPPSDFRCDFSEPQLLSALIFRIQTAKYKCNYTHDSILCFFVVNYLNFNATIYVKKEKKYSPLTENPYKIGKNSSKLCLNTHEKSRSSKKCMEILENSDEDDPEFVFTFNNNLRLI